MNMENKSTKVVDISTKVLETRKQTEELKIQLQNLIDSGLNSFLDYNKGSDQSHLDKENLKESPNKVQIIKSFDSKHSQHVNKPTLSNTKQKNKNVVQDTVKESPKKVRSYDVKEAREYIKKQREKRLQQLKSQNNDKIRSEIQKQKLQELHKKSLELVTKNVQANRDRSQSRERRGLVRPDQDSRTRARSYSRERNAIEESNKIKRDIKRTKSVDRCKNVQPSIEKRNPNLLYPPPHAYMLRNVKKKPDKQIDELSKKSSDNQITSIKDLSKKEQDALNQPSTEPQLNGDTFSKPMKPMNLFHKMSETKCDESVKIRENKNNKPVSNILEYANLTRNIDLQSPRGGNNAMAPKAILSNASLKDSQIEKIKPKPKLSEVAIGTDNLEKDTKETQTSNGQKIEFPLWLQEKPVAYPFNFINSVKRKLQDAVHYSKQSVDVGVQSSIFEDKQKTPENTKTKEAILEVLRNSTKSSKKSDLKSFMSHKCLNLDPKNVNHLQLVPKTSLLRDETITKATVTESESDTSKNIPEISSESESRSQAQNGSGLNIKRLNKLKLLAHNIKSNVDEINIHKSKSDNTGTHIVTETSNLLTINDEYTSEFQSESDLSKRRKSIIAFNSPSYHKQIIYDVSPEFTKIRLKHTGSEAHSTDIPQTESSSSKDLERKSRKVGSKPLKQNQSGLSTEKLNKLKLVPPEVDSDTLTSGVDQIDSVLKASKEIKLKQSDVRAFSGKGKSNFLSVNNEYTSDFRSSSEFSKSPESVMSYNKQIVYNRSPEFGKTRSKPTKSPIHSSYKGSSSPIHSKDIPSTISKRSNDTERIPRNLTETFSIKTGNLEMPTTSIKLTSTITNIPQSKTGILEKNSSGTVSTRSEGKTSNLRSKSDLSSKNKENKSSSSIPTETESRGSSKTLDSKKNISKNSSNSKKSEYTSLCTELHSSSMSEAVSKSDSSLLNVNTRRGCGNTFSKSDRLTEVIPLKEPTISLTVANDKVEGRYEEKEDRSKLMKNISLRSERSVAPGDLNNTNEIHLKFEAEIHLLNDFNESLRQFSAVEKAFESLKSKNDSTTTVNKILQNRDTQTSIRTRSSASTRTTENANSPNRTRSEISTINYSRGSFVNDDSSSIHFDDTISKLDGQSLVSTGLEISNLNKSSSSVVKSSPDLSNFENLQSKSCAEMTLKMFEQLIKDEDVRLENLKTILMIREQALLDRTKGELAWLEIQRKHLRETGKLQEASLIKKKQRGILVNHQKEKHEMLRLKQMQKAASDERKIILREQRNLIKHQLSTDAMLSKMKVHTPRERRLSGPLKVIQSHSESIRSETSISKRSSSDKEMYSITSHTHSIVSKVSEISGEETTLKDVTDADPVNLAAKLTGDAGIPVTQMKKTLLMREAALQKRRKAAEELLKWHKKLLEEERRITELESTANAIISHIPSNVSTNSDATNKYKFKGKQLNQLWFNLTGCEDKKFADEKVYPMSQISLERFCKSAREYSTKTKKLLRKVSDSEINSERSETRTDDSVSEIIPELKNASVTVTVHSHKKNYSIPTSVNDYASDFDVESIQEIVSSKDMDVVDQNLNQLIGHFSKIEADLSSLGIKQSLRSSEDKEDESVRSENTASDVEVSVIETTKTSREEKSETGQAQLEKINSDKNLSIIEKINKSTKDALSKSEVVLIRLSQSEDSKLEETQPPSEITYNLQRTSKDDKTRSGISEITSDTKSSSVPTNKKTSAEDNLSKTEEILEKPSKTEEYDIPYSKKSETVDETTDTLNKAREILEKLSQSEDSARTVSSKKLSLTVDDLVSNKTIDNLSKTEEILERLSLTDVNINSKISSEKKSSSIEENNVTSETLDNLNKTEEILENLSLLGTRIDCDILNKKPSIIEEKESVTEEISNTEDILEKQSVIEDNISADGSSEEASIEKASLIEENQVSENIGGSLSKTEDSRLRLCQIKDKISSDFDDVGSGKVIEENHSADGVTDLTEDVESVLELSQAENEEIYSEEKQKSLSSAKLNKNKDLRKVKSSDGNSKSLSKISSIQEDEIAVDDDKLSTAATKKVLSSKNNTQSLSQKRNLISGKDLSLIVSEVSERPTESKKGEEISDSPKETYVDEELSVDEPNLEEQSRVVSQEIIEIKDDEEQSVIGIRDDDEENTFSKEAGKSGKEIVPDKVEITEDSFVEEVCNEESTSISVELERIKELEANEETKSSTVSTKPDLIPELVETKSSNKEDLSPPIASDITVDVANSDGSHITESLPSDCAALSKEEINSYEEKEQDSLSSSASNSSQSGAGTKNEEKSKSERSKSSDSEEKSPRSGMVDVKKRVSEIMADASQPSRGDKSPRLQDLYVTTYDLVSPANSPELGSPVEDQRIFTAKSIFGTEAEEILRKQLAIEQEIKLITEQQQKEHIPYMYVREIPNKPPPPYTPPSSLPPINVITVVPTTQEVEEITKYSAKILHKAYLSNGLDNISISETTLGLISKNITKECYKFVFDICKEMTRQHYKQFEKEKCVSWLQMRKKPQLAEVTPFDMGGLERHLNRSLKELFGYEKPNRRENAIIKWSRKKRDHVDEILVMESQAEESQWTNYEKDELLVMNEVTNEIMNMLLKETGDVFIEILSKRT